MPLKDKVEGNELDLSLNQLTDVPVKELASASKATHLDLSCNQIRSLPNDFATLTHLVKIDLSRNKLSELPHNFGNLTNLQYLDLDKNEIRNVPLSFCRLKNLRWLDLKDNPLDPKLKGIAGDCLDEKQCQACAKKVVAYMQSIDSNLEREKQKKLKEEREREALEKEKMEKEFEENRRLKKLQKDRKRAESKAKREGKVQDKEKENNIHEVGPSDSLVTEDRKGMHWCTWILILFCFVVVFTIVILGARSIPHLNSTKLNLKFFEDSFSKFNKSIIQLWNSIIIPGALYIKASALRNIHSIMLFISKISYDIEILLSNYF